MESPSVCHPAAGVFNLQTALVRMGGDETLLRDLAGFYLEDVPPLLQQLRDAIEREDVDEAVRFAHTIKALSANFDAHALCATAQSIERAARAGELESARHSLPELHAGIDAVITALQAEFSPGM